MVVNKSLLLFLFNALVLGLFLPYVNNLHANNVNTNLAQLAKTIEENNNTIKQIEINKKKLNAEKDSYLETLSKARNEISFALINLHIIFSTPEEVLLITGATSDDLALSSVLFRGHLKYIGGYVEEVFSKIAQLNEINSKINKSNAYIESLNKAIDRNYKSLTKLVDKSKNANQPQIAKQYKELASLLEKSSSTTQATLIISESFIYRENNTENKNFFKEQGMLKWPAQGHIFKKFKEGDAVGLYYNGIVIKAKPKSTIVAPAKGKIMFAGYLKSYGNTIIIKHTNSYYSIISNVHTLNTFASELVEKGQMIGLTEDNGQEDDVYYEIREDITSLNPSLWLESN